MNPLLSKLPLQATVPPLRVEGNVVRVGNSRISLDLVVQQYENGMTPEDMARAYDSLALADAYAAVAYYLTHHAEVQTYLKQRSAEADDLQQQIEGQRPRISRQELEARRVAEQGNAEAGQ